MCSRRIPEMMHPISMRKPRKSITPEEVEAILRASAQGKPIRSVMELVNRSRGGIHAVIHKYPERLTKLRQQYADEAVSAKFGKSPRPGGVGTAVVDVKAEVHKDAVGSETMKPTRDALSTALEKCDPPPTLEQCESEIRDGLRHFYYTVGKALGNIREHKLYLPGFETFEEYCRKRWDFSKTHANRQIKAVKVVTVLGGDPKQYTEWQLRPFTRLSADKLNEIRQKYTDQAQSAIVPLTWDILLAAAGLSAGPQPAASKGRKTAASARANAMNKLKQAVGDAEVAVKANDMKAVAAALSRVRTALDLLFP